MMQITVLSLQFLMIIVTIEGRKLCRIPPDGLELLEESRDSFRALFPSSCPHETFVCKHVCTTCSSIQDIEKFALRVSNFSSCRHILFENCTFFVCKLFDRELKNGLQLETMFLLMETKSFQSWVGILYIIVCIDFNFIS